MKKWLCAAAPAADNEITQQFGELLGGVMLSRGITSLDRAREFFGCSSLSDPLLIKDMEAAVEVIRGALDEGKKITVFGDYDCDGITSTAMLYGYLNAMGAEADYYIPDRSEGYGMNLEALKHILDSGTELIITVDNGISAVEEAKYIAERGAQLVITDHHQPPQELPVCEACVDPHRADDNSPFKELCGAGVVLKLLCALEEDEDFVLEQYADLAAVGTVADVMPLIGENRFIVRRGLENIHSSQNQGLDKLIRSAGIEPVRVDSTSIAFSIAPRINAVGRIARADRAVELLLTESPEQAGLISEELALCNSQRTAEETRIMEEAAQQIEQRPELLRERVLVVSGEGWKHGVIGLVCAKLLNKYGKPVLVISVENGEARGSARGIDGFSIYKLLEGCSRVLTKFGGHPMAAGLSLAGEEMIEPFRRALNDNSTLTGEDFVEKVVIDVPMPITYITKNLIRQLSLLEPFGKGNTKPLFAQKGLTVLNYRIFGKNRNVVKVQLADAGGYQMDGVYFGEGEAFAAYVDAHPTLSVAYYPSIDTWNGRDKLQINIQSYF